MSSLRLSLKEKKVEYVELIYDLIFVYIVGRNNSLLHNFANGFVAPGSFIAYIMTTLAVIQIWNYTTYYINIYGRHGVRDHVFLFINMFLLYFIGEATRLDWQGYHLQYQIAWALILINIGTQYLIELRHHAKGSDGRKQILYRACILFGESVIVFLDIPVFQATGSTWLSLAAILLGMAAVSFFGQRNSAPVIDFKHLSERAMLYVVFTFGEMIIAIASYFDENFSVRNTYFALMAFLIVVALFLSYGMFYDHIINREKKTNGLWYMFLHVFIIFAMNNITNGLEFMREEEISLLPKELFLIVSFLLFFDFLFLLGYSHAKTIYERYGRLCLTAAGIEIVFIAAMFLLKNNMALNIAVSTAFAFSMFLLIYFYGKRIKIPEQGEIENKSR